MPHASLTRVGSGWIGAAAMLLAATAAHSQNRLLDSINEGTQLEICATYLPCSIAVEAMDGVADARTRLQKIRDFFSGVGSSAIKGEADWRARMEAQTPEWRKARVKDCLSRNTLEVCEGIFLTPPEQQAARDARKVPELPRSPMTEFQARKLRSEVLAEDDKHYNGLWVLCRDEGADTQGCEDAIWTFSRAKDRADALNADPEFRKFLPPVELRMEALARQTHEFDGKRWVRRKDAALAYQQKFDACERLRRDVFNAIDAGRHDHGKELALRLRSECSKVHSEFASLSDHALRRITQEAPPDPLAALPRRNSGLEGNELMAQTLQRGKSGQALDDGTLPGRGGVAAAGGGVGDTGGAEILGAVLQAAAGSSRGAANPVLAGLAQGMNGGGGARAAGWQEQQALPGQHQGNSGGRDWDLGAYGTAAGGGRQGAVPDPRGSSGTHGSSASYGSSGTRGTPGTGATHATAGVPSGQADHNGGAGNGNCKADIERAKAEVDGIYARRPANTTTVPNLQMTLYMIQRFMKTLDQSCRGAPEYAEMAGLRSQYDGVMRTCEQVSNASGVCGPRIPW